jgi:hypothetical protein
MSSQPAVTTTVLSVLNEKIKKQSGELYRLTSSICFTRG